MESQVGQGSTFHFTAHFGVQDKPAAVPAAAGPVDLQGMAVLVVDDNATNRRILEEILTNWRMKPVSVDSGGGALAAMKEARDAGRPIGLVLLDACMPGMDGFAVAEQIRQDPNLAGATVMMLTSAGRRGDAARCRDLGIAAYLTKPIRQSLLLDAIMTALGVRPATPPG